MEKRACSHINENTVNWFERCTGKYGKTKLALEKLMTLTGEFCMESKDSYAVRGIKTHLPKVNTCANDEL